MPLTEIACPRSNQAGIGKLYVPKTFVPGTRRRWVEVDGGGNSNLVSNLRLVIYSEKLARYLLLRAPAVTWRIPAHYSPFHRRLSPSYITAPRGRVTLNLQLATLQIALFARPLRRPGRQKEILIFNPDSSTILPHHFATNPYPFPYPTILKSRQYRSAVILTAPCLYLKSKRSKRVLCQNIVHWGKNL